MFSHQQCEQARKFTGRMDIDDKCLNDEYSNLKPDEKENATQELWEVFQEKNDLPILNILDISSRYFISEPVLFFLFKEFQAKQKMN